MPVTCIDSWKVPYIMVASKAGESQETPPAAAVAVRYQPLDLALVQDLTTPDALERFFTEQTGELSFGDEIADGYEKLENKDILLARPFIVVDWTYFTSAEYGTEVLTVRVMTMQGEKYRLSDGSTGIMGQLEEVTRVRAKNGHAYPNAGLGVKNGLRKSSFWVSVETGRAITDEEADKLPKDKKKRAATYYLDL